MVDAGRALRAQLQRLLLTGLLAQRGLGPRGLLLALGPLGMAGVALAMIGMALGVTRAR